MVALELDRASQPVLDEALQVERPNPVWTAEVQLAATRLLADDPSIDIDVRCGETLCRLRFTKPVASKLDWETVDRLLIPLATGETVFTTQDVDGLSLGGMYFAATDSHLANNAAWPSEDNE